MTPQPERHLIASLLLSPADGFDTLDKLGITPEYLDHSETRAMLQELLKMRERGEPIEQSTLSLRLPPQHQTAPWEVTSEIVAPAVEYWGALVVKIHKAKSLVILADQIKLAATNPETDLEKEIDKALLTLNQAQDKGVVSKSETLQQAAARVIDDLDNPPRFIPTPWPALNDVIGGLRPGAFYVVAARPGVGKSLFGLQLAQAIAKPDSPVAFFSFEMTAEELASRSLAAKTGLDLSQIDRRALTETNKEQLAKAYKDLTANLHLIATPSREVSQLRPAIRAIKANNGTKPAAVFIDYLGLMEAKGSNLYEKVTAISGQLKSLAMEQDLPVIALAQLNRKAEERPGAPGLADLRDSGAIEQDADLVMMLSNDDDPQRLILSVLKNRQGQLAVLRGTIDRPRMTLKDLVKA